MFEDVTIWIEASIRKYFQSAGLGLPVTFLQQGEEKEPDTSKGKINILTTGPNFINQGSRGEIYALVMVECFIETPFIDSDVFYHQRIKARVLECMQKPIPVKRVGHTSYDKSEYGFLKQVPTESIDIFPVSVKNPVSTSVVQSYKLELCNG